VKISAAQHGAAAWNREHAARYDFNRPGITVGIFLLGDALVFDIDAKAGAAALVRPRRLE